jgi:HK97 family phage major capsid protein
MRTVEEILADLRALAAKAATGHNVSTERAGLERELAQHGIRVQQDTGQKQQPVPGTGGSRFRDRPQATHAEILAGQQQPTGREGERIGVSGVDILQAIKGAKAGDPAAHAQLAAISRFPSIEEKALTGGAYLVQEEQIPGYVEALAAANPLRALATENDVTGREVKLIIEGDDLLVTEHVAEGATKPSSDATIILTTSTIFKAAGVTDLPDELIEDTDGEAANLLAANFARSIGRTVDMALSNGTGTGEPLGILRHPDVDHVTISGQQAMLVYQSIIRRLTVLNGRLQSNISVVVHPNVSERFDLALNANGDFLFPDGLRGKLTGKATLVEDANLPIGTGNTVPIIVGAFKRGLHVFNRKAIVIEQSTGPGFSSDETTFRAVERYGAAIVKPSSFEVIDGLDLDYAEEA